MAASVLIFAYRKPGLSLEEFKTLYEAHIEHVKELAGDLFPLSHKRSYIARSNQAGAEGATERNATTPAVVFAGQQSDFDFDAQAVLTFASQEALQAFVAKIQEPDNAAQIAKEEEGFLDRSKLSIAILGDVIETTK